MTDRLIKMKRSVAVSKRILPQNLEPGELFVNYNASDPGLFFKDNASPTPSLRKVGAAHVGETAPNSSPPGGFDANISEGELWFNTDPNDPNFENLLIYVGGEWKAVISNISQV